MCLKSIWRSFSINCASNYEIARQKPPQNYREGKCIIILPVRNGAFLIQPGNLKVSESNILLPPGCIKAVTWEFLVWSRAERVNF